MVFQSVLPKTSPYLVFFATILVLIQASTHYSMGGYQAKGLFK
jgi:hypothetical protein